MKYCKRCLYPANHPLHLTFDSESVCSGCRVHEEKDRLDWAERRQKLVELCREFKSRSGATHDCVVPVSGARDSHFIVHTVRKELGLNPLIVSYNMQYNTARGIRNLAYLRTLLGCDFMSSTVSPETVKKITRATLKLMGSIYWHCLAGQTVFPVQMAVRLKIPLIIWGAHQGCDQVGMFSHLDEVEMTRKYRKEHDLMGYEAEDLAASRLGLSSADLEPYRYPDDKEIEQVGVRGIYLGNYIRWDSKRQHENMIRLYNYESAPQSRSFDTYNDVDSFVYSDVHDYIKYLKYGYGKVTDHACREIRLRRLTRNEGIELVREYAELKPKGLRQFLAWLEMSEEDFYGFVNAQRDQSVWRRSSHGEWELLDSVLNHRNDDGVEKVALGKIEDCKFEPASGRKVKYTEKDYVLHARGWQLNT
ncbi:MAG: LPS biosynthesis protein [Lentisphaerae bacterium GWF2_52_8]|nr:MAG: LPS biosynthesis protein [Lentisphaerae bacterium GWF2_52_8]